MLDFLRKLLGPSRDETERRLRLEQQFEDKRTVVRVLGKQVEELSKELGTARADAERARTYAASFAKDRERRTWGIDIAPEFPVYVVPPQPVGVFRSTADPSEETTRLCSVRVEQRTFALTFGINPQLKLPAYALADELLERMKPELRAALAREFGQ